MDYGLINKETGVIFHFPHFTLILRSKRSYPIILQFPRLSTFSEGIGKSLIFLNISGYQRKKSEIKTFIRPGMPSNIQVWQHLPEVSTIHLSDSHFQKKGEEVQKKK